MRNAPVHKATPRRYAVIGAGALGGYYGACLQRAGIDVRYLLHSDYDHVRRHGWVVDSKRGNFQLRSVHAYKRADRMPRCDVALIALKATRNQLLPRILPHVLKPQGFALVLQNGLGGEERAAEIVGPDRVMGGLCFLCSNKVGPGHIHHLDYGAIALAEYSARGRPRGVTHRMRTVAADFRRAGIPIRLAEDLVLARWKKLVWNIPYNGLSVVLNATTEELMRDGETRKLVADLMSEVVAGAAALGRRIPQSFVREMLNDTVKMRPYRTSMRIDFDARRPMEVEAIFGNPLRASRRAGVSQPLLEMLYRQLVFLDKRNRRHRN